MALYNCHMAYIEAISWVMADMSVTISAISGKLRRQLYVTNVCYLYKSTLIVEK